MNGLRFAMVIASVFLPYLKSLLKPDPQKDDWQKCYVPTQAELPLRVQLYEPASNNIEQRRSKEQFDVLEGLRKYAPEQVLLVGKPGSGKSTALRRLQWEEGLRCAKAIEANKAVPPIPILLELRSLTSSVIQLLQKKLSWKHIHLEEGKLIELIFDQRLLLLLDGINELSGADALAEVAEFKELCAEAGVPLICSTREICAGANLGMQWKLEMLPLSERQVQTFVQKRLSDRGEVLLRQLRGRLRELAETPLLLRLLCDIFFERGEIPKSKGELFRKDFARRYDHFKSSEIKNISDDSRRMTFDLLCHLAFVMIQGEKHIDPCKPSNSLLIIPKNQAEKIIANFLSGDFSPEIKALTKAKEWLEDLIEWHLLQISYELDYIEFHHQLFQEYYASEWLLLQINDISNPLSDEIIKFNYLNYLKWTEPLAMMIGLLQNSQRVERLFRVALEVDYRLGARLAAAARMEYQEKLVEIILQEDISQELKICLLRVTGSTFAIPVFREVIQTDNNISIIEVIIDALEEINSRDSLDILIDILYQKEACLSRKVPTVLGTIGGELAIHTLQEALSHDDALVRVNSAYALKEFHMQESMNIFRESLYHQDSTVRETALCCLDMIGDQNSFDLIKNSLHQGTVITRQSIALYLGFFLRNDSGFIKNNILELLEIAINDPEPSICETTIGCLELIDNKDAIKFLENLVWSENSLIFKKAMISLEIIGNKEAVKILESVLINHHNPSAIIFASTILSHIGSKDSIAVLTGNLLNENNNINGVVPLALSQIAKTHKEHEKEVIDALSKVFDYNNTHASIAAIQALELLKIDQALYGLNAALNNPDVKVRRYAVDVLGKHNSDVAIDILVKALEDEDKTVCSTAAFSLWEIDNHRSRIELERMGARDEHSIYPDIKLCLGNTEDFNPETTLEIILQTESYLDRIRYIVKLWAQGNNQISVNILGNICLRGDIIVARKSISALCKINSEESIRLVGRSAQYGDDLIPYLSLEKLKKMGQKGCTISIDSLSLALSHEDPFINQEAIYCLGDIGNIQAIQILGKALDHKSTMVAQMAAMTLGMIAKDSSIERLERALKHDDFSVSISAVYSLRGNSNQSSLYFLEKALMGDNYLVSSASISTLECIGDKGSILVLEKALSHDNQITRERAAKALGGIAGFDLLPHYSKLLCSTVNEDLLHSMSLIQDRYQFYNYIITQSQVTEKSSGRISDNGINDLKKQLQDLRDLITQIQKIHQPNNEDEALELIDDELYVIREKDLIRWQQLQHQMLILKRQLLNPERHLSASKATLSEITKHFLTDNIVAKAIITYLDILSSDPSHGE